MRMPIAYAINDGYTKILMAQLIPLYENADADTIYDLYILNYQLKSENRTLIMNLVDRLHRDAKVTFLDVSTEEYQQLPGLSIWGREANFRSLLPRFLPEMDRILYLDADTFVLADLSHLMHLEFDKYAYAAVKDYENPNTPLLRLAELEKNRMILEEVLSFPYINSGVMMLNLAYWREHQWAERFVHLLNQGIDAKILVYPDQDILNYLAIADGSSKVYYLPENYNHHQCMNQLITRSDYHISLDSWSESEQMRYLAQRSQYNRYVKELDPFVLDRIVIIHFIWQKPWSFARKNDLYVPLFQSYADQVALVLPKHSAHKQFDNPVIQWFYLSFFRSNIYKLHRKIKLILLLVVIVIFSVGFLLGYWLR